MIVNVMLVFSAVSAAIAAWYSYGISRKSLTFQKKLAKNQSVCLMLDSFLNELLHIQHLSNNIKNCSGEDFNKLKEYNFREIERHIRKLNLFVELSENIKKIPDMNAVQIQYDVLDRAISEIKIKIQEI